MAALLHDFITESGSKKPDAPALLHKDRQISYEELSRTVTALANGLTTLGLAPGDRVATYLPKCPESVFSFFGTSAAGGAFVPINPLLKPEQVAHILRDSGARILVTNPERARLLSGILRECPELELLLLTEGGPEELHDPFQDMAIAWSSATVQGSESARKRGVDTDLAAILYTSGSTGRPKGVVLSHRNMVAGAESVAQYLENTANDRLLAVLPFSFDYGLSQLTTAFSRGASVALMEYLLPRDVPRAASRYAVTGLAAVPPLWNQLANLDWPPEARSSLRYITNSGGALPVSTTRALQSALPSTRIYLMYGLTEAFRSTYLPPEELERRPSSIGKAIPNADVRVVREDGTECAPHEPGELVHRGSLVSLGYWNDPEKTRQRFRPAPGQPPQMPHPEIAVWSGDQVQKDEEGFFYFLTRTDEMIKSSGYRISPFEVEEVIFEFGNISQTAAFGVPHPMLGEAVIAVVQADDPRTTQEALLSHCRRSLPAFMVPSLIVVRDHLPLNANGKIDRSALVGEFHDHFTKQA